MPGVEAGLVLNELAEPQWQSCQGLPTSCLEAAPLGGNVENILSPPSLCGELGFVKQPPIPWAWSQAADETVMPSEVLRLQITCHE